MFAIFESSFSLSYMLCVAAFALNHVNKVFKVADNVVSSRVAGGVECVT